MDRSVFANISKWMFEDALPLWSSVGIDPKGSYMEFLDREGGQPEISYRRVRVICRQIYVFSHAYQLGYEPGLELAKRGYDYLIAHAWLGEDGGWARRLSANGAVLDATPDLYDQAFVLFALGWYHRASGDAEAHAWARRTLAYIEAHMRHPLGGFLHEKPAVGPRQQNPHMHLLEACLANYEGVQDADMLRVAREIVGLFRDKFFDIESGTLAEFFEEDLSRTAGDKGRWIEPGHQFEWAWILVNHRRLTGDDTADLARAAVAFGEKYGVDPVSHATYNGVRDDGAPLDRASRTWPNTERMKAAVAMYELDGVDPVPVLAQSGNLLLNRYLAVEPRGAWIDVFDENGQPRLDNIPTSTLYHVFLAFAEALRIAPKLV